MFFRRIPICCWHDDFCLKFSIKKGQLFFQNYGPKSNQIDHVFNLPCELESGIPDSALLTQNNMMDDKLISIAQKISDTELNYLCTEIKKCMRNAELTVLSGCSDLLSKCSTQLRTTIAKNESLRIDRSMIKNNSLILTEQLSDMYLHHLKNSQSKNRILQQNNHLLVAKLAEHDTPQLVPSSPPFLRIDTLRLQTKQSPPCSSDNVKGDDDNSLTPVVSYKNKEGEHGDNDEKGKEEDGSMYQTSMLSRKRGRSSFEEACDQDHAKKFRSEIK